MKVSSIKYQVSSIFLAASLLLAVFLRFAFFGASPPSLNWDEASLGYNAFSVLKTGKDEWGKFLPLTFEAFGDYKLPGYVYTLVPFIGIFGLNEQAVRLPSQLAGVISVFLLYFIVRKLNKNEFLALTSAFLLAISPWHIFLSRAGLEANLALCFFMAGVYFFLDGLDHKKKLIWASFFWGITLFTYNSSRVFLPFFLLGLILIYIKQLLQIKKWLILPAIILAIFISVSGFFAIFEDSSSRYFWVNILDQGAINHINEMRGQSEYPQLVTKFVYNRPSYFVATAFSNYFSHFSPSFLFSEGGSNYQFSVPKNGLMYWVELPFLLFGLWRLTKAGKLGKVVLFWIFLAPIPAAITRESPHVLRSIFMLGGIQIAVAYGITELLGLLFKERQVFKKVAFGGITGLLFVSLGLYLNQYLIVYPRENSQSWQYGYKQVIDFANTRVNLTERPLFFDKRYGEAHIFYLFYNKYDPAKYQNNPTLVRYARSNWRWVDRLDNVYFINNWEMKEKLEHQHGYVITTPGNYPGTPSILKTIKFLDGKTAFEIVEI